MSSSVAFRVDSGIFLYSLGRNWADKEWLPNVRLASSVTDTTDRIRGVIGQDHLMWRIITSKSGHGALQSHLSKRKVMCPEQKA
jgi:hypothetical protein